MDAGEMMPALLLLIVFISTDDVNNLFMQTNIQIYSEIFSSAMIVFFSDIIQIFWYFIEKFLQK